MCDNRNYSGLRIGVYTKKNRHMLCKYFTNQFLVDVKVQRVKICKKKLFCKIIGMFIYRVQRVCRKLLERGETPKESYSGDIEFLIKLQLNKLLLKMLLNLWFLMTSVQKLDLNQRQRKISEFSTPKSAGAFYYMIKLRKR